jgi:poly-gamma-glutamate synthesis protein (capsule biosynthesis protein)
MKRFSFFFLFLFLGISGGVLVRYGMEQVVIPRSAQTAQVSPVVQEPARQLTDPPINLLFVGDIMLSRGVAYHTKKQGGDFRYPFLKIADTIRNADFAFGNLEGPISARGANQGSIYSFRARPEVLEGLILAGFDVLSLANNHISDWGRVAIEDTIDLLRKSDITPVGAGRNYDEANVPARFAIGDLRLAIFAYTNLYPETLFAREGTGISEYNLEKIEARIREVRDKLDFIVVSLHWGTEYAPHPSEYQKEVAHALVDAGADLIIGHHPHVVQDVEQYKNAYIFYSLGNFVFDQNFSEATRNGAIARVTVRGKKVEAVEMIPIWINDTFQATLIAP